MWFPRIWCEGPREHNYLWRIWEKWCHHRVCLAQGCITGVSFLISGLSGRLCRAWTEKSRRSWCCLWPGATGYRLEVSAPSTSRSPGSLSQTQPAKTCELVIRQIERLSSLWRCMYWSAEKLFILPWMFVHLCLRYFIFIYFSLPMAHTCFNQLMLPPFKDKRLLGEKLVVAISNSEGFGLI